MTKENEEQTGMTGLKRAQNFFGILVFGSIVALIGDILEKYRDYKMHPDYYMEPYRTLQEHFRFSLTFYGVVILICLSAWIILKIVERKNASSESDN